MRLHRHSKIPFQDDLPSYILNYNNDVNQEGQNNFEEKNLRFRGKLTGKFLAVS